VAKEAGQLKPTLEAKGISVFQSRQKARKAALHSQSEGRQVKIGGDGGY